MGDKKKIYELTFYFKTDSVIMSYRNQYICFNSFNIRNKRPLNKFSAEIRRSRDMDLDNVFGLARECKVPCMSLTDDTAVRQHMNRVN